MKFTIKILINRKKLLVSVEKHNTNTLKLVEKTEQPLEVSNTNNKLISSTILSRNLKHLDFIDQLEIGLDKTESKNYLLSKELNNIKRLAQVNTLEYLTKVAV